MELTELKDFQIVASWASNGNSQDNVPESVESTIAGVKLMVCESNRFCMQVLKRVQYGLPGIWPTYICPSDMTIFVILNITNFLSVPFHFVIQSETMKALTKLLCIDYK